MSKLVLLPILVLKWDCECIFLCFLQCGKKDEVRPGGKIIQNNMVSIRRCFYSQSYLLSFQSDALNFKVSNQSSIKLLWLVGHLYGNSE